MNGAMAPAAITTPMLVEQVVDGIVYRYQSGFGNELASEVIVGALPKGRNTPKNVPYGLYTEQLSGTAFTAPRAVNRRTWLYRIQPSVSMNSTNATSNNENVPLHQYFGGCSPIDCVPTVDACRWHPPPRRLQSDVDMQPEEATATVEPQNFIQALKLVCHGGSPQQLHGVAIYQYNRLTASMLTKDTHLVNADGDFVIVPCQVTLHITTELGCLTVRPTELAVMPRGMVFAVNLATTVAPHDYGDGEDVSGGVDGEPEGAMGYVLEVYSQSGGFQLPELGPIGSNGLANARDFLYPVAWCAVTNQNDYSARQHSIVTKMQSQLYCRTMDHTPYNVVAWHGNYLPYKYDLTRFCAVNSVTYDHLDPSLYTVLTCPSGTPGVALVDVVLFPPRVLATDVETLRPPWFHRNVMSECMGLIYGQYDAKKSGFRPGGASLHNCLVPHGPDASAYAAAVADPCEAPVKLADGMAFMFESCLPLHVAPQALNDTNWRDVTYTDCWQALSALDFTGWDLLAAAGTATETKP
jgi:homogentisate 1,2-dioxygenase